MSIIAQVLVLTYALMHTYSIMLSNKYIVINEEKSLKVEWYGPSRAPDEYFAFPIIQINQLNTSCATIDPDPTGNCIKEVNDLYDVYISVTERTEDGSLEPYQIEYYKFVECSSKDDPEF